MKPLLWNLLMALGWGVATGVFTVANLTLGFGLSFLVLLLAQPFIGASPYYAKLPQTLLFAVFYLREIVLSTLRVAYDVATPTHHMRPGVIAIPLDARTDVEITLLANLLSLTPGTLSLDLSHDRRTLYVHTMYIDNDDPDEARRHIKERLERRVLEVLR